MARYLCSYLVQASLVQLPLMLKSIFDACDFELQYQIVDYLQAREKIGRVNYGKLVTIEAFIDYCLGDRGNIPVIIVAKNSELPIYATNYCLKRFQDVQTVINSDRNWQIVADNVA